MGLLCLDGCEGCFACLECYLLVLVAGLLPILEDFLADPRPIKPRPYSSWPLHDLYLSQRLDPIDVSKKNTGTAA